MRFTLLALSVGILLCACEEHTTPLSTNEARARVNEKRQEDEQERQRQERIKAFLEGSPFSIEGILPALADGLVSGHAFDRRDGPRMIPAGSSVSFSPDGRLLATGSDDKVVRIWDVGSGCELAMLCGHEAPITCVSFSPDGR